MALISYWNIFLQVLKYVGVYVLGIGYLLEMYG